MAHKMNRLSPGKEVTVIFSESAVSMPDTPACPINQWFRHTVGRPSQPGTRSTSLPFYAGLSFSLNRLPTWRLTDFGRSRVLLEPLPFSYLTSLNSINATSIE